jgi:dTDP-4-amino-4,6-dideoxygalactose transaminase
MIPFVDLKPQHQQIKKQLLEAWEEIIDCTGFVGGPWLEKFETGFATLCDAQECVGVSSGTDALEVALRALGVKPGDEVIIPANTFVATAEAVLLVGASPILVDCRQGTWNIDPDRVREAVTSRTVGVIGVHLYGQPCDMDSLRAITGDFDLWLLEDSAQAHLATYKGQPCGSLGDAAAFSFYPGKNLGATGEGGAITTNDPSLATRMRELRNHGSSVKYIHKELGNNSRLSSVIAAGLAIKLDYIAEWTNCRRQNAALYMDLLADVPGLMLPRVETFADPVWHLFVVHLDNPKEAQAQLQAKGISTGLHYPVPLHLQEVFADRYAGRNLFPNTEHNASHCLSLPMYAELTAEQITQVCTELKKYLSSTKRATREKIS